MLGKAPGLGADMVFLDLEDAVAPLEKEAARDKVVDAIKNQDWGDTRPVRARQRVGHRVDRTATSSRSSSNAGERLDEIMLPEGAVAPPRCVALDLLLTQIETDDRAARRPRRHRGADRDRARA